MVATLAPQPSAGGALLSPPHLSPCQNPFSCSTAQNIPDLTHQLTLPTKSVPDCRLDVASHGWKTSAATGEKLDPKISSNFDRPNTINRNSVTDATATAAAHGSSSARQKFQSTATNQAQNRGRAYPMAPRLSFSAKVKANLLPAPKPKHKVELRKGKHMGKPSVHFKGPDYWVNLAENCKFTLIGKFSKGKPGMDELRKLFVSSIPLKDSRNIGLQQLLKHDACCGDGQRCGAISAKHAHSFRQMN